MLKDLPVGCVVYALESAGGLDKEELGAGGVDREKEGERERDDPRSEGATGGGSACEAGERDSDASGRPGRA